MNKALWYCFLKVMKFYNVIDNNNNSHIIWIGS